MPEYADQTGRTIYLKEQPRRIISLVPSQTELLHYLGLGERVLGITKFCIHPDEWYRSKTRIGGTKSVNHDRIAGINPDLIIGNKEENTKEDIEKLAAKYPIWLSDVNNLEQAFAMIRSIGGITGTDNEATTLTWSIFNNFSTLPELHQPVSVAYLIWKDPLMIAAKNTFIHDMLSLIGLRNVFSNKERYPIISADDIASARPDILLLSSEPYPFREKHIEEFRKITGIPSARIVDGEMFSWYGPRLLKSASYFRDMIETLNGTGSS